MFIKARSANFFSDDQYDGYITQPLPFNTLTNNEFYLFDHNGYDLTNAEIKYCENAGYKVSTHRHIGHVALKRAWFYDTQPKLTGAHINHAALFERKGYKDLALYQLREVAQHSPLAYKVINIKPKWGVDLSIDYVDDLGNTFEVLHFEYDCFNFNEAEEIKKKVEDVVLSTDWNDAAHTLLSIKDEWENQDFFAMSEFKCRFFGLPKERFKETIWHGN